ncbi:fibroblast growth factor receptor 1-like isoform X2 [Pocillopora verrucosa]|uniref:fibroblast growth factor receptor 1-like isoform X2 n=1 Tax=Pocillopora verrucosa TaxID=203993 RepID=UPI0033408CA0
MIMDNFSLREASTCLVLLTLTGALWNRPFVRGEKCGPNIQEKPVVAISSSPENNSFPIGASINLTCKAEPRAEDVLHLARWVNYIRWYDPQGNEVGEKCQQRDQKMRVKSCPLVLKNLTVDKFGNYTCQSGNDYPNHCTRKSFNIAIQGAAPELIGVPRNQSADIGANVTFNCTAIGFPKPIISWIKNSDSSALQSNLRVKFINDSMDDKSIQSQLLLIVGVKMEDFGKYQCKAESVVGKNLSLPAFLTPKGSDDQLPEIVKGPKNQSVPIGSDAIFSCTVNGLPRPTIHWIRDDASHAVQSNTRARVIQGNRTSQLLITGVEMEDYGKYRCIANNSIGRSQSEVAVLRRGRKNGEEASTSQMASIAVLCASGAVFICLITVLVWHRLRNGGEEVQMPLLCTVEGGLGDREPPDGSKQPDSMQDINERGQESSNWGEKIAGGDDVIACGGVDSCVDEQGNGRQISRETEEGFDNMENLEVLDEVLGEGEFGIVYKGRYGKYGNVTDVAVKKLKGPNAIAKKALLNEIRTLKQAGKHPNIITLVGTRIEGGNILVVTELIRGDSLENLLKAKNTPVEWNKYQNVCCKLNDRQLVTIAFQIAEGMQHLQERKGNFPWRWSSLESLRDLSFTSASDVWSFGIVLWEIATYGGLPYPDITSPFALVSQLATGYRMPRPDQCSEELYELMSSCWKENPLMRPKFSKIASQLKSFLREVKRTYINITEDNNEV